jgi:hypothetical protein
MAKKQTPEQQIKENCEKAVGTIARWKSIRVNGCNDPGWPDGVNMNLLRNHLMSYKKQIRELCIANNLLLPPEVYTPDLPYTDCNYFAKPESDRAKRIMNRPGWQCYNHEPIGGEYDERQLSLF